MKSGSEENRKLGVKRESWLLFRASYLPNYAWIGHGQNFTKSARLFPSAAPQRVTPRLDCSTNSMKVRTSGRSGISARAFSMAFATVSDERKKIL